MELSKKKVVLFLPAWYPSRVNSQSGNFIRTHGLAIKDKLTVKVLHIIGQKGLNKLFEFTKVNDELETFVIYYRKPASKSIFSIFFEGILYLLAALYGYYRFRKTNLKPDFFHVHVLTRAAILPLLLSFFKQTKYVITEHWTRYLPEENSYHGTIRKFFAELAVKRSRGLSAVSLNLLNALEVNQIMHQNSCRISNVVNDSFFVDAFPKKANEIKKFLHVSVFNDRHKNISGMLRAFKSVQNQCFNFELTLVGDGKDYSMLRKYADELCLKNVKFLGMLEGENLLEAYRQADSLVLFSRYENQPMVILEAQAMGLPIISSNVGGVSELITEKFGVLVEPGNEEDLVNKLICFLDDKYIYDNAYIKDFARLNYSSKHVANTIISFYKNGL
jgi:glycosyltransferase involved in cell wall biosynthesis